MLWFEMTGFLVLMGNVNAQKEEDKIQYFQTETEKNQ